MEIDGSTIKLGTKHETKSKSRVKARGIELISVFALMLIPASANLSDSMVEVASMIDAMSVIWVSITDMIIDLIPLMLVIALVGFILGVFAMVLKMINSKGVLK